MTITRDPTLIQRDASDPAASVWVAASAGSGKTKVLTDRVLRLLLTGTSPSRIVCLTYTHAAAAEMKSRLFTRLSRWAVLTEDALTADIEKLTGQPPTRLQMQNARRLFTEALEDSPGLRIQTIHSFCQSVLARFPLEAGVPPNFEVLDERTADEMLEEARLRLLTGQEEPGIADAALGEALEYLIGEASETSFTELLSAIIQQRRRFVRVLGQPGGLSAAQERLYQSCGVPPGATTQDLRVCHFFYMADDARAVRSLAQSLLQGQKTDVTCARALLPFLESDMQDWQALDAYLGAFLTKTGEVRKKLPTQAVLKADPRLEDIWQREAKRCRDYLTALRVLENTRLSAHTLTLAHALFAQYDRMKRLRGVLDFDDLILHTRALLCDGGSGSLDWVLYKLDGGIDHLLLDEAQDTSAEQWEITQRLVEEFYAGLGAHETERTLFVVGDGKQSIYRFQGAEPEDFFRMRHRLGQQADHARHIWREVSLDVSFRSVQAVLDAVDATFSDPAIKLRGLDDGEELRHTAYRAGEPGRVELWPLLAGEDIEETPWTLPSETRMRGAATHRLAQRIAQTIRGWLNEGRRLAAEDRPITPGDILILLRSRGRLAAPLANALRQAGVPVAGLDRMQLTSALAVRDLMALGQTLLLPQGDLVLACVLKSPLYNLSEEALFTLCHGRGRQPLWERLMEYRGTHEPIRAARDELAVLYEEHVAKGCGSPYEFYTELLYARDAMKRFTARMGEGVRELLEVFLEQARLYEMGHPPSLQGFLHWLEQGSSDIKRDMEQRADEVRIMTVHGAKGLEAPIVFLPDTASVPRAQGVTFISNSDDQKNGEILLRLPSSKDDDTDLTRTLRDERDAEDREEHFRLLYVAMTRARDELYICGAGEERENARTWYQAMRDGLLMMDGMDGFTRIADEDGERLVYAPPATSVEAKNKPSPPRGEGWVRGPDVEDEATRLHSSLPAPDGAPPSSGPAGHLLPVGEKDQPSPARGRALDDGETPPPLPGHAFTRPAPEPPRRRALQPSKLMDEVEAAFSPTTPVEMADDEPGMSASERGTLMHRLLHILSAVAPAKRHALALDYLARYRYRLSAEKREAMVRNLLLLMADPIYAPIFGLQALSEVSVTGLIEDASTILPSAEPLALSGQIDRLLVTPERILIVDFKTGELPDFGAGKRYEIPELYRRQMEAYRQLLQAIYPGCAVECALIYTAVPILLPVPATLTPRRAIAI